MITQKHLVAERKCVFVLGMHRSGTSAFNGTLQLVGFDTGNNPMPANEHNPKGYFEDLDIAALNDRILNFYNRRWDSIYPFAVEDDEAFKSEIRNLYLQKFGNIAVCSLKDPRLCLTFPIWQRALTELGVQCYVVIVFRNPLEVCQSLENRNKFSITKSQLLWANYLLSAEKHSRHDIRRIFVRYDRFLSEPSKWINSVFKLIGTDQKVTKEASTKVHNFLDPSLNHYEPKNQNEGHIFPWVNNLFKKLSEGDQSASICDQAMDDFQKVISLYYSEDIARTLSKDTAISTSSLYINTGEGFKEEQRIFIPFNFHKNHFVAAFKSLSAFENIKCLRWDPLSGKFIQILLTSVVAVDTNGRQCKINHDRIKSNGTITIGDAIEFLTLNPWIELGVDFPIQSIIITGKIWILDSRKIFQKLNNQIKDIELDLHSKKTALEKIQNMNNELLDEKAAWLSQTKDQILELHKLVSDTKNEVENERAKVFNLFTEKIGLVSQITEQKRAVEKLTEERDILTKERDILTEERDILTKERDILIEEKDILIEEKDILIKEKDILIKEKRILSEEKDILTEEKNILNMQLEQLHADITSERNSFINTLDTKETGIKGLKEEILKASRKAKADQAELTRQLNNEKSKTFRLKEDLNELSNKLGEAVKELSNNEQELAFYKRSYAEAPISARNRLVKQVLYKIDRFFTNETYIPDSYLLNKFVFDATYYLKANPHLQNILKNDCEAATKHWIDSGVYEGLPSAETFHVKYYLESNKDLKIYFKKDYKGAIKHWIEHGIEEARIASPGNSKVNFLDNIQGLTLSRPGAYNTFLDDLRNRQIQSNDRKGLIFFISGESTKKPGYIYRVSRYAEAFKKLGEQVEIIARQDIYSHLDEITNAKLIVLWRANWQNDIQSVVEKAKESNIPVIFDIDDLMVKTDLVNAEIIDAIRYDKKDVDAVKKYYAGITQTMLNSSFNTASTHELAWHMRSKGKRRPTFVLPNGYDHDAYGFSRACAREKAKISDGLIRIGYASGGLTHQRDFEVCVSAVAQILRQHEHVRLVLFKKGDQPTLDINEFPALQGLETQLEWRSFVPLDKLPAEIARFDINLCPLQIGNPFCEAKSELKFFEAAICDVPTIASPTGPFKRSITHNETGLLASTQEEWLNHLNAFVLNATFRKQVGREAHRRVLWPFGPTRRAELVHSVTEQLNGGRKAARAFFYQEQKRLAQVPSIPIVDRKIIFESSNDQPSQVTVIIPLHNYELYIEDALESVKQQTLPDLDLIVVDDLSTDRSQEIAHRWMTQNAKRFNRIVLVQHLENQGLGASRNTAFDLADTLYIMALDADNKLLPECCEKCFEKIHDNAAAFAYPTIQQFGDRSHLMGSRNYFPADFIPGNGIDAMAMISKEVWALVGGYVTHRRGWQDYDFWCRVVDVGLHGIHVPEILAEYRVHNSSMLRTSTNKGKNKLTLIDFMESEHPWLSIISKERNGHQFSLEEISENV